MVKWDWRAFCDQHGIRYVERSSNVARGNVNTHCPFCGSADTSEHMGLSETSSSWGCWRDPTHRGHHPARLVARLLRIPHAAAMALVDEGKTPAAVKDLRTQLQRMGQTPKHERESITPVVFPAQARVIHRAAPRYQSYLLKRGFTEADLITLGRRYGIHAYGSRILLPMRRRPSEMIGWYGRAIDGRPPRYLAHPDGPAIKRLLWNQDLAIAGGQTLVVLEGQFDALKVDLAGADRGVRAVSCQTTSVTAAQLEALRDLRQRYNRLVVMFDPGAYRLAEHLRGMLVGGAVVRPTPQGYEDVGAMPARAIDDLVAQLMG